MKRTFAILFSLAALFAACNKPSVEEPVEPFTAATYAGTVSVAFNGADFDNPDIRVDVLAEPSTGTLSITIHEIRFAPQMPVTVDVTIPDVHYKEVDGVIAFEAQSIVPLSGVVPMERYKVSGLNGSIRGDRCEFSLSFGNYPTSFSGDKI